MAGPLTNDAPACTTLPPTLEALIRTTLRDEDELVQRCITALHELGVDSPEDWDVIQQSAVCLERAVQELERVLNLVQVGRVLLALHNVQRSTRCSAGAVKRPSGWLTCGAASDRLSHAEQQWTTLLAKATSYRSSEGVGYEGARSSGQARTSNTTSAQSNSVRTVRRATLFSKVSSEREESVRASNNASSREEGVGDDGVQRSDQTDSVTSSTDSKRAGVAPRGGRKNSVLAFVSRCSVMPSLGHKSKTPSLTRQKTLFAKVSTSTKVEGSTRQENGTQSRKARAASIFPMSSSARRSASRRLSSSLLDEGITEEMTWPLARIALRYSLCSFADQWGTFTCNMTWLEALADA